MKRWTITEDNLRAVLAHISSNGTSGSDEFDSGFTLGLAQALKTLGLPLSLPAHAEESVISTVGRNEWLDGVAATPNAWIGRNVRVTLLDLPATETPAP